MENTVENNRLIASFLGYESYEYRGYTMFILEEDNHRTDIDLYYHGCWNWLMTVVDKINGLNKIVEIRENWVRVISNTDNSVIIDAVKGDMKEAVYFVVVEFIKWHNANQNQNSQKSNPQILDI